MNKYIKITQIKSTIGRLKKHKLTIKCLGLKRIKDTVIKKDTKEIRGMINLIFYMIKIEE